MNFDWRGIEFTMQITLGNLLVFFAVVAGVVGGIRQATVVMRFLEKRFEWVDEMYFFYCRDNNKRVPASLAAKFVKANGEEKLKAKNA